MRRQSNNQIGLKGGYNSRGSVGSQQVQVSPILSDGVRRNGGWSTGSLRADARYVISGTGVVIKANAANELGVTCDIADIETQPSR